MAIVDVLVGSPALHAGVRRPADVLHAALLAWRYIRNTPNLVASTGLFSAAEIASPSTLRVSAGSITPSSHNRALA